VRQASWRNSGGLYPPQAKPSQQPVIQVAFSLDSKEKVSLKETKKSVTPIGGVFAFLEYLKRIGFQKVVASSMPFALRSPNAIPPIATFTVFILAVACGARRYSHTGLLRQDEALRRLLGIKRMPNDDTIRNLFLRF